MKKQHLLYELPGFNSKAVDIIINAEKNLKDKYEELEYLCDYHQSRVLNYMRELNISQRHFYSSTGYGYSHEARETLDKLFALVFGTEDALVRPHWVSGTHILSDSLFALLKPGETMLSVTGAPYDTLRQVIGTEGNSPSSLKAMGINYIDIPLLDKSIIDIHLIAKILNEQDIKLVLIQRSCGYEFRPAVSIENIGETIKKIKSISKNTMVLVDNCYGEFTQPKEPGHFGADIVAGSLNKNPGGGLAPTGAYAAGTKDAIELLSYRLTAPGIGREVGSYSDSYRPFYQGLFMAPHTVLQALKGAILTAKVFDMLGFSVEPKWNSNRNDIVQTVKFNTKQQLISFCQTIQSNSPVDSNAIPYPWDMPGYNDKVIMAAGTFMEGASIELSADAPIVEPYIAYVQGGLTYSHVKTSLIRALSVMIEKNEIII